MLPCCLICLDAYPCDATQAELDLSHALQHGIKNAGSALDAKAAR